MELVQELVLTAFIAVLFSYLVAKLVSFAMVGTADSKSTTELKDVDEDIGKEELKFGEKLSVGILERENRVELVEEEIVAKVEKFQEDVEEIVESGSHDLDIQTELSQLPEKSMEVAGRPCQDSSESEEKEATTEEYSLKEAFENKQVEETAEESDISNNVNTAQSEKIRESNDISVSEEDDEWEGVERSELEKAFGAAAKYLDSGDKDDFVSDVHMELYGLHKIATEGPCHEPQPMALMLSARAKWNAWQKLGNMSPEEAMERYVKLLSDRLPGWMEESSSGDFKLECKEAGKPDAVSSELGSSLVHQTNYTLERNPGMKSDGEADDQTAGSNLETVAKE